MLDKFWISLNLAHELFFHASHFIGSSLHDEDE
jgi:hypothetical protein